MVFESIVVDLLNRFLGDYVENLDRSQLKLGIWGGDVVLKSLEVKQSALDDLDLPVKIVSGHLGNLTLKIPWKNLYTAPVVASIDGLYIVVIPNSGIKYNEEKEDKANQESKQKQLLRIEEAKEREAQKGKATEQKKDSFAEKMATQVIKNLQVKVKNIHVRFEDTFTNPSSPFAFGVTLSELAFETTDENWKPCIVGEAVKMIHKLITLDSLAVYWNSDVKCYSKMSRDDRQNKLISNIASKDFIPNDVSYVLGPINSSAQVRLNPKPENDGSNYSIPKILMNVVMQEIAVGISKYQYMDVMDLLQSFERMSLASMYRKYRPDLPYKGHAKQWWKFGLDCVLNEDVRRRRKNWSWLHMKEYRKKCKTYKDVYKLKLGNKKLSKEQQKLLKEREKELDVFNLTLARKQAEVEVERQGIKDKEAKANKGWFGGWLGGGGEKKKGTEGTGQEIVKQFEEAMTAEEKSKLYSAIDYQENSAPAVYPKEFIENQLNFTLNNLTVSVKDDTRSDSTVLKLQLKDVGSCIEQRPSADAIKVTAKVSNMTMLGSANSDGKNPEMITSLKLESEVDFQLLDLLVETNPLDKSCDQRVHLHARPLQIVYHADTVNNLASIFKPPEYVVLAQIQAAAMNKIQDIKQMSATGLQYAIEQHKYLDLQVDLKSSYIIVPEFGAYERNGHMLVLDLGNFQIKSIKRNAESSDVKKLVRMGSTEDEVITKLMDESYDKFDMSISNVQILISAPDEDWQEARLKSSTNLHLLRPTSLMIELGKCIIIDQPRLPKLKISGELPNININISDEKLMQLAEIGLSIPIPQSDGDAVVDSAEPSIQRAVSTIIEPGITANVDILKSISEVGVEDAGPEPKTDERVVQMTDLELKFEIKEIVLEVSTKQKKRESDDGNEIVPMMAFTIQNIGTVVSMKTFEMSADLHLGAISLQHMQFKNLDGGSLYLIKTAGTGDHAHLLSVEFLQVNENSPELKTKYDSTLQRINVNFCELNVILHQDAILSTMSFANKLTSRLQDMLDKKNSANVTVTTVGRIADGGVADGTVHDKVNVKTKQSKKKKLTEELIDMKLVTRLDTINVTVCTLSKVITDISIGGVEASVILQSSMTKVVTSLDKLVVCDPTPQAIYPKIVSAFEDRVIEAGIIIYNNGTDDENYVNMNAVDMSLSVKLGRLHVIFLNRFVADLLSFADNFQIAKDKLAAAGAAAAEVAKQSVESAYEKASRVLLNVTIQAPVIHIPQSSTSTNALIAHLGVLNLTNRFELGNKRNELGMPVILDRMSVILSDFKLSRTILDPSTLHVKAECLLLEPISIKISVVRNMTIGWFKELPEIDVGCTLSSITMSITQEDFTMVMNVLNENLTEGQQPIAEQPASTDNRESMAVAKRDESDSAADKETKPAVNTHEVDVLTKEKVYKRVKFSFNMDSFGITLYKGSSSLGSGLSQRNVKKSLAAVQLHKLIVKGEILSNNSLWANLILMDVLLDDLRKSRQKGITRYMERKSVDQSGSVTAARSMVDITFSQDAAQDKYLEMKVFSFVLIICLDYLLEVADFFVKGLPTSPAPSAATSTVSAPVTAKPPSESVQPSFNTKIKFTVEQPDIMLIQDVEDINSNAIILNSEIKLELRITPEVQSIIGGISNLQLLMCCYNPDKRSDTINEILSPCSFQLTSSAPFGRGQHVNISATDLILHVSPGTIAVLTAILSTLTPAETTDDDGKVVTHDEDYQNIWIKKKLSDCNYWFLKTETGSEAAPDDVLMVPEPIEVGSERKEQLIATMDTIVITVEAGVGSRAIPMILLEMSLNAEVQNWSSNMTAKSVLSLEMAYFNEKMAKWEPLIEPVDNPKRHQPWEIFLEVAKNEELVPLKDSDSEDTDEVPLPLPAMTVNIFSQNVLEMTVSKVCLDVLTQLGKAFGEAVQSNVGVKSDKVSASLVVKNETGIPVTLILDHKSYTVMRENSKEIKEVLLEADTSVPLNMIEEKLVFTSASVLRNQERKVDHSLNVKITHDGIDALRPIAVAKTNTRYFQLPHCSSAGEHWGLVADIVSSGGTKTVILRSHVQVHNHFSMPIEVYYMMPTGNEVHCCGIVEPNTDFSVPLNALYTNTGELFFKPQNNYSVAFEPFVWRDLIKDSGRQKILECKSHDEESRPLFINVTGESKSVLFEETNKKTLASICYTLHLRPTAILRNLLPYPLHYTLQGHAVEQKLDEGKTTELLSVQVNKTGIELRLLGYLEMEWGCRKTFDSETDELSVWTFESANDKKKTMDLGAHTVNVNGSLTISLYCPFWMVNKTELLLTYRQGDDAGNFIYHPPDVSTPVLFSFKPKNFFSKKKACLKVADSEWSDKFAMDVVGSSGKVTAKAKDGKAYEIGIQIKLSNSGLTKIVIFTPFYVIVNNSIVDIECIENVVAAQWFKVPSKQCVPFWPNSSGKQKEMIARIYGTIEQTPTFSYVETNSTLMRLQNKYGGLKVEGQTTESEVILSLSEYHPGDAAVLLVNNTDSFSVTFNQKGNSSKDTLEVGDSILFSWTDPLGKCELVWSCGDKQNQSNQLIKDGIGDIKASKDVKVYWVSFLDGLQRVLMFTEDLALATVAQQAGELERPDQEINLCLNGVGISLVNNGSRREILYIGVASSGVLWEVCKLKSRRFKSLSMKECETIEAAHQRYLKEIQIGKSPNPRQHLDHKIEVDFNEMKMYKPNKRLIRRSYQNGVWLQYKSSPHRMQLHAKINRVQIDNQLPDAVFRIVLAPLLPPKSVAADSVPKPFTEVSLVLRKGEFSSVQQFKYFKVLIQEFHIKMDQGLINELIEFFVPVDPVEIDHENLYREDLKIVNTDLKTLAAIYSSQEQKNFYDELHLSPLKVHISFSMTGTDSGKDSGKLSNMPGNFVSLLLKSVGVTVTEIQDVVFKLAFFERRYQFMTQNQLISEVAMHYTGQVIKQMYVLVLGLDVIGNPFGLVLGITQGVEDLFYEPFQGAIQGPEEFAEGLALGVRSLFGSAVGGAAGAASRITGTLGKGIAALTMDDDYQKQRREALNRRPANVSSGLAQSGKGLVMGVFEGVTGIVTKPVEGAKKEGFEGFFKGVGKGLIGVVARPTAGAVDFASGSLEAIKKVTEVGDETKRLRPPRYIHPDGIVRPYVRTEAEGHKLLLEVEKGKFVNTDNYMAHLILTNDHKFVLLITDKRIMLISKGEIFGQWNCEWHYPWEELKEPPIVVEKGFKIMLKEPKKKKFGLFGGSDGGKFVTVNDPKMCAWIVGKAEESMKHLLQ